MNTMASQRLHASWQIAAGCIGLFVGVVIAGQTQLTWPVALGWLLTGVALWMIAVTKQRAYMVLFAIFGGMLIGLWRGSGEQFQLTAYQSLLQKTVTLTGVVGDDADTDAHGATILRLKDVHFGKHALPSSVWVSLATKNATIERSDRVQVRGLLQDGFGNFAGVMYRADVEHIERPEPGDVALHVRDWFASAVRRAIPEPEASLGVGYLVGQRRALPEELDTALKLAGLTHIVVASGYNLTILVRLARRLFEKISKYMSLLMSSAMIVGFVAITGLSPSMSRAGLIAGLSLLAWYYGRTFHPLVLLPLAVAVTVMVNPHYAWGDVGWQLSFAAFAGVMIIAPLLQVYYFGAKKPGVVRQIAGETIAATIATLPILLYHFGYMSNVAIIANIMILPLIPLAMLLTFFAGVGALVVPSIAIMIGMPAYGLLSYMTHSAEWFAALPWATSELSIGIETVIATYVFLTGFVVYMWHKTRFDLRKSNIVE